MSPRRMRLRIYGEVQGVFLRASTRQKARALGLVGWVRNCDDGGVEIEAEGDEDALTQLKEWCKGGPAHARVERVEEDWGDSTEEFEEFEIR